MNAGSERRAVDEIYTDERDASFDSGVKAAFANRAYRNVILARVPPFLRGRAESIAKSDGGFFEQRPCMDFQEVKRAEPILARIDAASI